MKRAAIIFSILIGVLAVIVGSAYYVYSKLTYKFVGLNFSSPEFDNKGIALPTLNAIAESIGINFILMNASFMNIRITKFNLKVNDDYGNEIGKITEIKEVFVPKNGENNLAVTINNINTNSMIKDFLSGKIKTYTYTISGRVGGFLPFKYTAKIY